MTKNKRSSRASADNKSTTRSNPAPAVMTKSTGASLGPWPWVGAALAVLAACGLLGRRSVEVAPPPDSDMGYLFSLHRAGVTTEEPNPVERVQLTPSLFEEHQSIGTSFFDARNGQSLDKWPAMAQLAQESRANATNHMGDSRVPDVLVHEEHRGVPFVWPPVEVGHKVRLRANGRPVVLETLALSPKVFYVHNFLSDAETEELIRSATDERNPYRLRKSTTGHKSWTEGGEENTNSRRTSENGFDISSETSKAVKRRAFDLAKVAPYDERMADGVQVLRYLQRQAYVAHEDYFDLGTSKDHNWDPRFGGTNRFATVFLYLSDVEAGGQTVFPAAASPEAQDGEQSRTPAEVADLFDERTWQADMVEQCYNGFAVSPKRGDALLFYSQFPDGALDEQSIHGGCPVLNGTKWAANIWIWNGCRYGVCSNV